MADSCNDIEDCTFDEDPCDEDPCDEHPCDEDPCDEDPCDEDPCDEDPCDEDPCDEDSCDEDLCDETEESTFDEDPCDAASEENETCAQGVPKAATWDCVQINDCDETFIENEWENFDQTCPGPYMTQEFQVRRDSIPMSTPKGNRPNYMWHEKFPPERMIYRDGFDEESYFYVTSCEELDTCNTAYGAVNATYNTPGSAGNATLAAAVPRRLQFDSVDCMSDGSQLDEASLHGCDEGNEIASDECQITWDDDDLTDGNACEADNEYEHGSSFDYSSTIYAPAELFPNNTLEDVPDNILDCSETSSENAAMEEMTWDDMKECNIFERIRCECENECND